MHGVVSVGMILGSDMMPRSRSKRGERDDSVDPSAVDEIEGPPRFARVIRLPCIVVGVSVDGVLAFELDALWRVRAGVRHVEIEVIDQALYGSFGRGVLDVPVGVGVGIRSADGELRGGGGVIHRRGGDSRR